MTIPKIVNSDSVWPRPRFGDNLPFARHGQAAVALLEPKNILAVVRSLLSRSLVRHAGVCNAAKCLVAASLQRALHPLEQFEVQGGPPEACARRVSSPMSGLVS
jgi:hypothetical protein